MNHIVSLDLFALGKKQSFVTDNWADLNGLERHPRLAYVE